MCTVNLPLGLKLIQSERAQTVVFVSKVSDCFDSIFIPTLAEKELWGSMKMDDQHPAHAQDKDKGSTCVEQIPPSHIIGILKLSIQKWYKVDKNWVQNKQRPLCSSPNIFTHMFQGWHLQQTFI
jgi:hypothetical protein